MSTADIRARRERAECEFDMGRVLPTCFIGQEAEIGAAILAWIGREWCGMQWLRQHGCEEIVRKAREAYVEEALRR